MTEKNIGVIQLEYGDAYNDAGFAVEDIKKYLERYEYFEFYRTGDELLFVHKDDLP